MGINTPAYKIIIFTLAAALAGLAGSLYAQCSEDHGYYCSFIVLKRNCPARLDL